jgi:P27 family predicted phage terminase small subunit
MDGNPGKRPINQDIPVSLGMPVCPDHLNEYARKTWNLITDNMPSRLYGAVDTNVLAAYCVAASLHRDCVIELKTSGAVVTSEGGAPYQSPWISILNRQAALIATLGTRLGLDPAARNNLSVKPDGPVSRFAGLVGIPGGRTA